MRPTNRIRAFVLLSTMFVVVVLGLILRAAMIRMPSALSARQGHQAQEAALRAAHSGLDYAISQLREDPSWQGGQESETVVEQVGLKVRQEQGNVIGEITEADGSRSQFRLRFNFHDGADGGDGRPDPSEEFIFEMPMVSVNNLTSSSEVALPRVNPKTGVAQVKEEDLDDTNTTPAHSVRLAVEGTAGSTTSAGDNRRLVEAVYQLAPDGSVNDAVIMAGGDLNFEVKPGEGTVYLSGTNLERSTSETLRLRSKGSVSVRRPGEGRGPLRASRNTLAEVGQNSSQGGLQAEYDPDQITAVEEDADDGKDFYNLRWDQVPQADRARSTSEAVQIPGGVYVYGQEVPLSQSSRESRELRYYDMSYQQYLNNAERLAEDPSKGVTLSANLAEVRSRQNLERNPRGLEVKPATLSYWDGPSQEKVSFDGFKWSLKKTDMFVRPSAKGQENFMVVARNPSKVEKDEARDFPSVDDKYNPDHMSIELKDAVITATGNVVIQGGVNGKGGTVVSEKNITVVAGRTLTMRADAKTPADFQREFEELVNRVEILASGNLSETELDQDVGQDASLQLNLYAKGDLTLSTYVQRRNAYRSMSFKGLLYSWGDVNVVAGRNNNSSRGLFTLDGALVAYGNDPGSEKPGRAGKGEVNISARHANLNWDPRYLPSLSKLQPEGEASSFTLKRTFLHQHR